MKKYFHITFILIACLLISCKMDKEVMHPDNPNDQELITTVKMVMVDELDNSIIREAKFFEDPNGTPGSNVTIDTVRLDPNKIYNVQVYLLDESKLPVDTISHEVEEESDEHQLFYVFKDLANNPSGNLMVEYIPGDIDSYGVPLGLAPKFTTTSALTGKLTIILKHQPGIKPTSGQGNINLGDTDVEVVFPVKIQ